MPHHFAVGTPQPIVFPHVIECEHMRKVAKRSATVKTRYGSFVCVFEPERDMGGFVVTAPKVQGAVSWGKNLAEAKHKIVEAIEGIYEGHIIAKAERSGVVRFTGRHAPTKLA